MFYGVGNIPKNVPTDTDSAFTPTRYHFMTTVVSPNLFWGIFIYR